MIRIGRLGGNFFITMLVAGVVLGFAGVLHPAADSLSLLRMPLAALCLILALLPLRRVWRGLLLVAAIAGLMTTLPSSLSGRAGGDLVIYSKNLWFRNDQLPALAADIQASGAEVVTLQEVSDHNRALLALLADEFPNQHLCRFSGWSGVAVLSRHAITDSRCTDRRAVAAARIDRDGEPVWIAAVHLPWPYPYGNASAARSGAALLAELTGPVVMAGDFNIFPWAHSVQEMAAAVGLQTAGPIRPTYWLRRVPLFLDHIHAPGGGTVQYRQLLGSDHAGILGIVNLRR